jgi:tetratricopeptide (TPR) repeat protein
MDHAEELAKAAIDENDASQALFLCEYGSILLAKGDYPEARRILLQAANIMESFGGTEGREVASVVGEEGHKIWKGEPYERAMNAYYLGLLAYMAGDLDNALAGFKNAGFQDAGRTGDERRGDFGPALYLQGRIQALRKDYMDSTQSFQYAKWRAPQNRFLDDAQNVGNVVVVVDVGRGPQKVESGAYGSELAYADQGGSVPGVRVSLDRSVDRTDMVGDLYYQAASSGPRDVEGVLQGKAAARGVAEVGGAGLMVASAFSDSHNAGTLGLVGAALFFGSNLLRTGADTRCWGCLPREIHIYAAQLDPGTHQLTLDLPVTGRVQQEILVEEGKDTVVYYRASIPYRRPEREAEPPPTEQVTTGE